MNWFTGLLVYAVVWWLVFFMVLPVGVKSQQESDEDVVPGTHASAPQKPDLVKKLVATTLLAAAVWGLVYLVIAQGWIGIRA